MMRVVFILSSLWLAMASAAPINFEVGCQSDGFDETNTETENKAAITDHSADDSAVLENGTESLTGALNETSGNTYSADAASITVSGEAVIAVVRGMPGQCPVQEITGDYAVAYASAEAENGAVVVDHNVSIARNEDGAVSGFADSFAQATSGDSGYAKAVSIAISDGGSVNSSVAIARAE